MSIQFNIMALLSHWCVLVLFLLFVGTSTAYSAVEERSYGRDVGVSSYGRGVSGRHFQNQNFIQSVFEIILIRF